MKITAVLIIFVFFDNTKVYGDYVLHDHEHTLKYKCKKNEDLDVDYEGQKSGKIPNITSLVVSSCNSVRLSVFIGVNLDETLTSIKIENIKNKVEFTPYLSAVHLKNIEFLNIGEIAKFGGHPTFTRFNELDRFRIENTYIGEFDQSFNEVEVKIFKLKNVMISNLRVLDFSSTDGTHLEIIDSIIHVDLLKTNDSLNFASFDQITITNTTFKFPYGGNITIAGRAIHLSGNVFLNASVNIVGREIRVIDTCADGPGSTMRIQVDNPTGHRHNHHNGIVSERNRFPSGIIYASHHENHRNNIVCPNAKCDCPFLKPKLPGNFANSYHDNSRGFFLYFIIIASAILTRV